MRTINVGSEYNDSIWTLLITFTELNYIYHYVICVRVKNISTASILCV